MRECSMMGVRSGEAMALGGTHGTLMARAGECTHSHAVLYPTHHKSLLMAGRCVCDISISHLCRIKWEACMLCNFYNPT